jgi:hypothetical protein
VRGGAVEQAEVGVARSGEQRVEHVEPPSLRLLHEPNALGGSAHEDLAGIGVRPASLHEPVGLQLVDERGHGRGAHPLRPGQRADGGRPSEHQDGQGGQPGR